jgi:hypothetical protein
LVHAGLLYDRQSFEFLLGEPDGNAIIDEDDLIDRDRHLLATPQMALLEQQVGGVPLRRLHHQPMDSPNLAIGRVHMF